VFDYSADNLLTIVRDLIYAGSSQRDFDDPRLLRMLNRHVDAYMMPMVMAARKNHHVTFTDKSVVAGQNAYYAPTKACGGKLRALHMVDSAGNPYGELREASLEQAINYGQSVYTGPIPQGVPQTYYWRGNQVVLFPTPAGNTPAATLRFYYAARPSTLVKAATCVAITGFPGGAAQGSFRVQFASAPATYTTSSACDLVMAHPGFDVMFSGTPSAVTSTTMDFVGTQPTDLAVGDYVCLTDTAPVVTGAIPELVVDCLCQKVALEVMNGKALDSEFRRRRELLRDSEKAADAFLRRRTEGDHAKVGGGSLSRFRRGWSAF
jgi:hypothetical protein